MFGVPLGRKYFIAQHDTIEEAEAEYTAAANASARTAQLFQRREFPGFG